MGGSSAVHLVEVRGGVLGSGKENQCNNSLDKEVGDCLSTSCLTNQSSISALIFAVTNMLNNS